MAKTVKELIEGQIMSVNARVANMARVCELYEKYGPRSIWRTELARAASILIDDALTLDGMLVAEGHMHLEKRAKNARRRARRRES